MAHGKETPRQKMIGMMYLVLTALLALNVAAEVLNAFSLIDNSLRKTTELAVSKNDEIYSDFVKAKEENPAKAAKLHDKAFEIKKQADELVKYIQSLKVRIVKIVDGPQGDPNNIVKKDDINVPGQVMITEKEGGKSRADILKGKINAYRDFLESKVKKEKGTEGIINGLRKSLNTDDVVGQEGAKVPWTVANFEHLPMAGVVALMSKMQADVRNAESTLLNYLYSEIDAGSFKFNKIEAIVTSESNYVLKGQPFQAQVFIAASDSTVTPVIKCGGAKLRVEQGKGIYTGSTSTPGPKSFGGVIELKNPKTGQIMKYPFKSEYMVGEASLVVSPTKMNVFYIGVDNPVDVSVPGVPQGKIAAYITGGGSIKRKGNSYVVRVKGPQGSKVKVGAKADLNGQKKNMGSKEFRVKRVPSPVAMVGGKKEGFMDKSTLAAQSGVAAVMENFDFDLKFRVISFTVSTSDRGGFVKEARASSARFTSEQKRLIKGARSNSMVLITNIKAKGPDGSVRPLNSVAFKVR